MHIDEYLSIRRAYSLLRQQQARSERLSFEEFGMLCHLYSVREPQSARQLGELQNAMRPTAIHRINHLLALGLIERMASSEDKRVLLCSINDKGIQFVEHLVAGTKSNIPSHSSLGRTTNERIVKYVDTIAQVYHRAVEVMILVLYKAPKHQLNMGQLAFEMGAVQPAISMAVSMLEEKGWAVKENSAGQSIIVRLTDAGISYAKDVQRTVYDLTVRRRPRKKCAQTDEKPTDAQ